MPTDSFGYWHPDLFPKQQELLEACRPSKQNVILASGPRWASKTFACAHAVCQHAWDTDRGNVCVLTITQSVGIDSGVWQHLTEIFLPEWIDAGFGMEWVREPYIQSVTKKPTCVVSNVHGGETRISLESLKNEDEVEARFKGKAYSMIWVNELSKFFKRKTLDTLLQCFRMPHLTSEQHVFLSDSNPCLLYGQNSWIYQIWYSLAHLTPDQFIKLYPGIPRDKVTPFLNSLKLIEFTVDDNLALSEDKKKELFAQFAHDQDLLQAYYYGKWTTASTDALFYEVFRPTVHVVGETSSASNPDPAVLVPREGCYELITGWDPGGTNCAAFIISKELEKRNERDVPAFKALDELVVINEDFDLREFVETFVRKMDFWEHVIGKPAQTLWRHWSDRSVFDMKVPFSEKFWHQHIYEASMGRVSLMAAERGRGSVAARVDFFRKLLWEERFYLSAEKCPQLAQSIKSLRRGKSSVAVIDRTSRWKHAFDAATYALCSESFDELHRSVLLNTRKIGESSLVAVPL